jgi:DNA-binding transcriptional MerR regulator
VEEHLTVGRLAELAGVTVRTLHHYDEIGLVRPSARTRAGYRAYAPGDAERLRLVLTYRRLGFGLREVAELVSDPDADAVAHLRRQRGLLLSRRAQADAMITAIDKELEARAMGMNLTPQEQLEVFGTDKAGGEWADEAERRWGGTDAYQQSRRRPAVRGPLRRHRARPGPVRARRDRRQRRPPRARRVAAGAATAMTRG